MDITYGLDIKSHEDQFLQAAERAMQYLGEAVVPGAFLVDTIPIRVSKTASQDSALDSPPSPQSQVCAGVVPRCGLQDFRKGGEGSV